MSFGTGGVRCRQALGYAGVLVSQRVLRGASTPEVQPALRYPKRRWVRRDEVLLGVHYMLLDRHLQRVPV